MHFFFFLLSLFIDIDGVLIPLATEYLSDLSIYRILLTQFKHATRPRIFFHSRLLLRKLACINMNIELRVKF